MADILNFPGNNPNPNPNLPLRGPQGEELPENADGDPYVPWHLQDTGDQVLSDEEARANIGGASTMDHFRAMLGRKGIGLVKFGHPTNVPETVSRVTDENHDENYDGPVGDYTPTYYDTMFRRIPGGTQSEEDSIADGERRFRVQDAARRGVPFSEGRDPWEALSDNVEDIMEARSQKTGVPHVGIEGARHLPGVPVVDRDYLAPEHHQVESNEGVMISPQSQGFTVNRDGDRKEYLPRRDVRISGALKDAVRALRDEIREGSEGEEIIRDPDQEKDVNAAAMAGYSVLHRLVYNPGSFREVFRHAPAKTALTAVFYHQLAKETFGSYWQKAKNLRANGSHQNQ
ncbi:MAG TPA: hypothetical protein VHB72_00245 [Candidatus Saccharimonadales bacterium]|nr:hypothetical protein [Candidatus Saccharimonadales bacterium]